MSPVTLGEGDRLCKNVLPSRRMIGAVDSGELRRCALFLNFVPFFPLAFRKEAD